MNKIILNISYLVHKILGIIASQIEIENIFNMVGVITNLRCYWLGIEI
jgi:hypothetical protein